MMVFQKIAARLKKRSKAKEETETTTSTAESSLTPNNSNNGENEVDNINEALRNEIPELAISCDSVWAFPLSGTHWLDGNHRVEGQPAYQVLRDPNNNYAVCKTTSTLRKNFVYGWGKYGYGYYHFMTRDSWIILRKKIQGFQWQSATNFEAAGDQ